jgi:hypothetical protein
VKQGDSLRTCLFNYFVKYLHDIFDESCSLLKLENTVISSLAFADGLVIFSNSHKGLQNALNKLQKDCFDWQLTVNTNKSKILTFQKVYTPTPSILYNDQPLTETIQYNFLGTIIDHKGCFKRVRIIAPTARYSDGPLFRRPIIPTTHYSDSPLLRRPIFPTMQNRTQSTNPWFNQVYPTGWSVSQANLDGPWPRQNVLERKRSFYPRLYIPAQGNYDRPTWYGES